MPGIVGIIRLGSSSENQTALGPMLRSMMHEAFYASGTLMEEKLGLAVGWTALENSFSDCLQVWNEARAFGRISG